MSSGEGPVRRTHPQRVVVLNQKPAIHKEPYYGSMSFDTPNKHGIKGGFLEVWRGKTNIGRTDISIHTQNITYPFGDIYPKNSALITTIELNENERGKGIGTWLLSHAEQYAKQQGATRMYISNVGNEDFFKKHGYKHTGNHRVWVKEL